MKELLQAIANVRDSVKPIDRSEQAGVGNFSYKYTPLEDVQSVLHPELAKNQLVYIHNLIGNTEEVGVELVVYHIETEKELRTKLTMKLGTKQLTYTDSKGREVIEVTGDALDPQKRGSVYTYFRRYSLAAFFGLQIKGEDDDGSGAAKSNRSSYKSERLPADKYIYVDDYENKDKWKATPGAYYDSESKRWAVVKDNEQVRELYKELRPKAYDHNDKEIK